MTHPLPTDYDHHHRDDSMTHPHAAPTAHDRTDTTPGLATPRLRWPRHLRTLHQREPLLTNAGIGFLALGLLLPLLSPLDPRTILGLDPWLKPTKFALSIGIYILTVAALLAPLRANRSTRFVRGTTIVTMLVEQAVLVTQSARGTTSHFNFSTPLNSILWGLMGLAIVVATVALVVLGVQWAKQKDAASPFLRTAVLLGIGIMLLGSAAGQTMVQNNAHSVGVSDTDAEMAPLTKWTTNGGDLRIAHFLGLHGLQAIPLAAIALTHGERAATRGHWLSLLAFGLVYAGLTTFLYVWALMGRPFLPL